MTRRTLFFTAEREIELRESPLPPTPADAVLVETHASAISAGTEMLIYRNQMPHGLAADATIAALGGELAYPLKYGYAAVGTVIAVGKNVSAQWEGRTVFAFNPHESHFLARPADLLPLPDGVSADDALFLPNMETAVNFLMDGRPIIGERVVVFGLGIVGLLTTALLAKFPLARLVAVDALASRREMALALGAHAAIAPTDTGEIRRQLGGDGADVAFEVSGAPAALNQAIAVTGFGGRVVIGSWYGTKPVTLDLGGTFHRSRIELIASQVSTIAPKLSGRWDKTRRFGVVWDMLADVQPSRLITHRFSAAHAAEAYRLIDRHPADALQVVLDWSG